MDVLPTYIPTRCSSDRLYAGQAIFWKKSRFELVHLDFLRHDSAAVAKPCAGVKVRLALAKPCARVKVPHYM